MLYRTCKRLIERSQTAGLAEKIDVFYALGRIIEAEYKELTELLAANGISAVSEQDEETEEPDETERT